MEDIETPPLSDDQEAGLRRANGSLISGFLAVCISVGSVAIGTGLFALVNRALFKTPIAESFNQTFSGIGKWIAGGVTAVGAVTSYFGLKSLFVGNQRRIYENINLRNDNIAMRQQLNQTGQILRHVAGEVEKGHLSDSQLLLDEHTAPPTHVAKLEAKQAAEALADAPSTLAK